ncbi:MAG: response regulator transcription factor [Nitrospira sp.]|nr:response regulator transcription factor [Nitrospira sp.]
MFGRFANAVSIQPLSASKLPPFAEHQNGYVMVSGLEIRTPQFAIITPHIVLFPVEGVSVRVLVIEDETKVGCFIKRALEEESYAVDLCEDGAKGLEMALVTDYDLLVVDLMLPSMSGMEILKTIRRERIQTPVLILTAQSQIDQRVKGLDAGADDYLTKPFAIDELLARVRALLRRGATESPGILQIDDLVLNPATRDVTRGGQRIDLTLKEYALLEYLMRHTGRVLTRPMISEHVWNQDFDTFTNVIDVYVNYLRNKIDRGRTKKLIHTIRGSGYMLKAD